MTSPATDTDEAFRSALIIFNPTAGKRRRARLQAVIRQLERRHVKVDLRETRFAGDATVIARATADRPAGRRPAIVVAAGGDGTINEVVNGLAGRDQPLGIIPLGTANVAAIELRLPAGPARLAAALAGGMIRRVRLGLVEWDGGRRHFLLMAGIGFDAHVVADIALAAKRRWGRLAYVAQTGTQLRRFAFKPYRLEFPDGRVQEVASAVIANGRRYGGRFVCAPRADLGADRLDICAFTRSGPLAALGYGLALGCGVLPRLPSVESWQTRDVAVDGPAGDPIQLDGDIRAYLPARISIASATLDLVVPAA